MTDKDILILIVVAIIAFWFYTTGRSMPSTFDGTQGSPAPDVGSDLTYISSAYTPPQGAIALPDYSQGYDGIPAGQCDACSLLSSWMTG